MNEFQAAFAKQVRPGTPVKQFKRLGGKRGIVLSHNGTIAVVQWLSGGRDTVELSDLTLDRR